MPHFTSALVPKGYYSIAPLALIKRFLFTLIFHFLSPNLRGKVVFLQYYTRYFCGFLEKREHFRESHLVCHDGSFCWCKPFCRVTKKILICNILTSYLLLMSQQQKDVTGFYTAILSLLLYYINIFCQYCTPKCGVHT